MAQRPEWFLGLACAVCFGIFAVDGHAESERHMSEHGTLRTHTHSKWSLIISPVTLGKINTDFGESNSDAASEYAVSMLIGRRLSRSAMLDLELLTSIADDYGPNTRSYLMSLTPKLIVPAPQRDRMFFGLGVAILALRESDEGTRWSMGPQVTLGMDFNLSQRTCMVVAGEAGFSGTLRQENLIQGGPPEDEPHWEGRDSAGSTAWARLLFGLRVSP